MKPASATLRAMTYAFVQDISASWHDYQRVTADTVQPAPAGLILHLAGPTDEGFRVIGVWESKAAWERFRRSASRRRSRPLEGRRGRRRPFAICRSPTSWPEPAHASAHRKELTMRNLRSLVGAVAAAGVLALVAPALGLATGPSVSVRMTLTEPLGRAGPGASRVRTSASASIAAAARSCRSATPRRSSRSARAGRRAASGGSIWRRARSSSGDRQRCLVPRRVRAGVAATERSSARPSPRSSSVDRQLRGCERNTQRKLRQPGGTPRSSSPGRLPWRPTDWSAS